MQTNTKVPPTFPLFQGVILCIILLCDTLNLTIIFPFVVFMTAQMLGQSVDSPDVNLYSGLVAAVYPMGQFFSSFYMGKLSDFLRRRKPLLIFGLISNTITYPLFGIVAGQRGLYWGIVAIRFSSGLLNGNIGLCRTSMGEICHSAASKLPQEDFAENKAALMRRGFSIMAVFYPLGLSLGSVFGGVLAQPAEKYGGVFDHPFFQNYRYMLPCLVTAVFSLANVFLCALVLQETYMPPPSQKGEKQPLLAKEGNVVEKKSVFSYFTRDIWLCVLMNGILGIVYNSFSELFPLWAKEPHSSYGLDFNSTEIGLANAMAGPIGALFQLFFFPRVIAKLGILNGFKLSMLLATIVTFFNPTITFTLDSKYGYILVWLALAFFKGSKSITFAIAHATLYIIINNTALATGANVNAQVNGFGQSLESLGKMIGPFGIGLLYTWAVTKPFPYNPFFTFVVLSVLCFITFIMACYLKLEPKPQPKLKEIDINNINDGYPSEESLLDMAKYNTTGAVQAAYPSFGIHDLTRDKLSENRVRNVVGGHYVTM